MRWLTFPKPGKQFILFTLFSILCYGSSFAQCAGTDGADTVCDKTDPSNQTYDLNLQLGGTPDPGGTWSDDDNSGGLDPATGILNLWQISRGGIYTYTYTVAGGGACTDNDAVVTLTLGSFAGQDNNSAVACDDDSSINLFSFVGSGPSPTLDGTWTSPDAGTALSGSNFNAAAAGQGIYNFTYTTPAIGSCPSDMSTVRVEVFRAPDAGTPEPPLVFCETDDLTAFTNYNLRNELTDEDGGGRWTENSGTSEISGPTDSNINIENIRDTFGPGIYTFTYTVDPTNPICAQAQSTVTIEIEEVIDFTGATLDITDPTNDPEALCVSDLPYTVIAQITEGTTNPIPDGTYDVEYQTSPAPNAGSETVSVTFSGGVGSFPLNSTFLTDAGTVTIEVISVTDPGTSLNCQRPVSGLTDELIINPNPDPSDTQIVVTEPICEGDPATVALSDAGNTPGIQLSDGTYTIDYTLTGPSGTNTISESITVSGGASTFTIASTDLPEDGAYTITITQFTGVGGCTATSNISDDFTVSPLPDASAVTVTIDNVCVGDPVEVVITDPGSPAALTDGTYDFEYDLSGAINQSGQVATNVVITGGTGSFFLPNGILTDGNSTLTLTNITNATTTCDAINLSSPMASFVITRNPDFTNSVITVEDVCQNEDATVTVEDTEVNIPDATYSVVYDLSGANAVTNIAVTVTFANGDATFSILASQLTAAGTTTLTLTDAKNASAGCDDIGLPRSVSFEVLERPVIDNATVTVAQPICEGESAAVNIVGGNVADGDYELTYDLTGANTATAETITVTFTGGNTSFTINSALISGVGTTTLTITNIVDQNFPNACDNTVTGVTTSFEVSPNPDTSNASLTLADPICEGDEGLVTVTDTSGLLADGDYTITYDLSGANTATANTANLTLASGTGSFVIAAADLTNVGTTTVTFTTIVTQATGCSSPSSLSGSFEIQPIPDLSGASVSIADICLEDNATAVLTAPALADGTYDLLFSLSGNNTATDVSVSATAASGTLSFTIDSSLLTLVGTTNLNLTQVANQGTGCLVSGLTLSDSFEVFPLPEIDSANLSASDECLGADVLINLTGTGLDAGDYTLTYTLSGANSSGPTLESITVSGGTASFTVAAAMLPNSGTTTLTIGSTTNTTTGCSTVNNASIEFEVFPLPVISSANVRVEDSCLNTAALVEIVGTGFSDGTYTFSYDLSGANTGSFTSTDGTFSSGTGTFTIPETALNNTGTTTLTITEVISPEGCSSGPITATQDFEVLPLPDASGTAVSVDDICLSEDAAVVISGATSLADGDYLIAYLVTGSNSNEGPDAVDIVAAVTVIGGTASFTLPAATLLQNPGTTVLELQEILFEDTGCTAINLTPSPVSFEVQDPALPTVSDLEFCINDDPTLNDLLGRLSFTDGVSLFDTSSGGTPLSASSPIVSGTIYYAEVTDPNTGCVSSQRLTLELDLTGCENVLVPDGFSPNGDGINDQFEIENVSIIYPNFTIEIFNRNGNVVYKGNANSPAWDGTANQSSLGSKTLPSGVYFYVINYNDGETAPRQGRVYLNR
ncbi:T9SS type B sorting domain-containing protein [Croceiramulus getboli]|nr:gliding motility-associated C-terminal domain-containing protein [Flavobacteriaceae bacterium YJPT1-3]